MLATWRRLASTTPYLAPRCARSIAFIAKPAAPGRGLKKDPEEYMTSPNGTRYPGTSETLAPLKKLLGDEFVLRDSVLLQCLVHKSFAHGKVPYNEKLAILGQQLLRLQASRAAAEAAAPISEYATINGHNFNINSNAVDILASTPVLSVVCDRAGLEPAMFYKPSGPNSAPLVKAKAVHAIVGALILERGTQTAISFINSKLLSGDLSVFGIADSLIVHK